MSKRALFTSFPRGIPTLSGIPNQYVWGTKNQSVLLLHNDWDLFWVQKGEASWEFQDGTKIFAGPDQFALLPPFVPAMIRQSKPSLIFRYCHFSFRLPPSNIPIRLLEKFCEPSKQGSIPLNFSGKEAPKVKAAYQNLIETDSGDMDSAWLFEKKLIELVTELVVLGRRLNLTDKKNIFSPPVPDQRLAVICQKINANPVFPWSIPDLARTVGLSTSRLHAISCNGLGKNLKNFIIETRLRHALKLLKELPEGKTPSIKEVSNACGFSSQHFFSRQFKDFYHMTPLQYRNSSLC